MRNGGEQLVHLIREFEEKDPSFRTPVFAEASNRVRDTRSSPALPASLERTVFRSSGRAGNLNQGSGRDSKITPKTPMGRSSGRARARVELAA
jgi:hypothetical protein